MANIAKIMELYTAYFNRAADKDGVDYWANEMDTKAWTLDDVANSFAQQTEYTALYAGKTNAEIVALVYTNVLNRAADTDGATYWEGQLTNGAVTVSQLIQAVVNAATEKDGSGNYKNATDAAIVNNKTAVSQYAYDSNVNAKNISLAGVTADVASIDAAKASVDAANPANVGETFTLTNSATADTIIGTDKSDVINGPSGTVANADIIIDQSTTDNDTANLVLTANYTPSNISKIENVNLDWDAYTTPTYNLAGVKGAKTVTLTSSKTGFLGNATVTNATDMTLVAGNGMVGDLTASGFKTGTVEATNSKKVVVNGTTINADNASIIVNAGTSTTDVTVGTTNGFKSTTVNAGTAGTVSVQDAGNTTDTTNVTVNKSAVNLTVNNAGATTLTTGANNVVTMATSASVIGTELTVKGEGNATLVFAANDLAGEKITNAKTSGDLIIKSADTNGEDISKVQATLVEFTAAQAGATTVATGANLKYSAAAGAINVTITGTSTTDTATAELTASQTSVTATGVETLNLKANATTTSGTDLTISTLATNGNKVVLTGTNDVALTAVTGANGTVDATALSGDLSLGTAASVTIKGATGKNTITTTGAATDVSVVGQNSDDTVTASVAGGSVTAVLADGKNTVSATSLDSGTLVVTGGSGIDTVTAGAALTTGVINLNLGDGNNVIALADNTGAGTRTVVTGGGDDTLTFTGASLDDANDTLSWTAGAGTDTLVLATAGADLSAAKVTLSGVEVIKVKGGAVNAATLDSSVVSGSTITIKADSYNAGTEVTIKGSATATTIDMSGVTIDQSVTAAVPTVNIDASANTTTAVTITGTSVKDIITGGDKGDTIVAGNGADTITGGKGNDTIDITETSANQAVDTIMFSAAATNGQDTIIGFKSGTDKIDFTTGGTTINTANGTAAVVDYFSAALTSGAAAYTIGAGTGAKTTSTADVVVISTTLSSKGDLDLSSTGTELLKALSSTDAAATQLTVSTAADKFYLVAYQDNKAYLYHADAGAANTAVTADEIKLIGTFNDITAGTLVAADFIA